MSFNICAITGQIVQEPMFSLNTGHVFEKRIIEKHLQATGKCPITEQDLTLNDLIELKSEIAIKKPRTALITSVPNLLTDLQTEFSDLLSETYNLKRELEVGKQEL